ncbi:uncharacterized protein DS421_11g330050 [Arachis hypogaea]|nr:uncharacterized protein DS421_11g330050 [Arachis hypogaea]
MQQSLATVTGGDAPPSPLHRSLVPLSLSSTLSDSAFPFFFFSFVQEEKQAALATAAG